MSKTRRILCLLTIMLTNIAVMADLAIVPIIADLYKAFPAQTGFVDYIVSGPMLIVVGSSLLATFLLKKLSKKTVISIGGIFFAVGAICGVLVLDAVYIAFMRTLAGIGMGFVNVVAVSLIADIYEDEDTRAKLTGYYNASMSLVAIGFSYFSGIVASAGKWQDSFLVYWSALPMVIMILLFIPSIRDDSEKTDGDSDNREGANRPPKEPLGWRYWQMAGSWLVMNMIYGATVLFYIAVYISENNLGDAAFAGIATSVKSIVGFLIGIVFGWIYTKTKRQTNTIACLVASGTILYMLLYPSQFSAVVMATIAGCAYKISFAYAYTYGFKVVPASRIDDAVAITTAVYGIGSFLSTFFASWLLGVIGTDRYTSTWIVAVVIFVVLAAVEIITSLKEKKEFTPYAA